MSMKSMREYILEKVINDKRSQLNLCKDRKIRRRLEKEIYRLEDRWYELRGEERPISQVSPVETYHIESSLSWFDYNHYPKYLNNGFWMYPPSTPFQYLKTVKVREKEEEEEIL